MITDGEHFIILQLGCQIRCMVFAPRLWVWVCPSCNEFSKTLATENVGSGKIALSKLLQINYWLNLRSDHWEPSEGTELLQNVRHTMWLKDFSGLTSRLTDFTLNNLSCILLMSMNVPYYLSNTCPSGPWKCPCWAAWGTPMEEEVTPSFDKRGPVGWWWFRTPVAEVI